MASKAGPVEIVVDIVGNFKDELDELQVELEKIDQKKVSVDFEIDSEEEIKKVQAQLKQLKKQIDTVLDIDVQGEGKAAAIKAALSKDMESTLHVDTDDRGKFPGVPPPLGEGPMDAVRSASHGSINRAVPDIRDGPSAYVPKGAVRTHPGGLDSFIDMDTPSGQFTRRMQQQAKHARRAASSIPHMPSGVTEWFGHGDRSGAGFAGPRMGLGPMRNAVNTARFMPGGFPGDPLTGPRGLRRDFGKEARQRVKKLARALNRLRPNIMMVWNALAAMIPIFISLGAAAIGLAGGMIAIATAGAAILGLGLLGWGKTFGESMENLKQEAKALGSELFDVLQPAARVAQPIMMQWMEGAPRQIQKLVNPLRALMTEYDDTIGQIGGGIVDWVVRVIDRMVAMEDMISQITLRFGGIAGDFLIDVITNLIEFAYNNQDVLIRTAGALRDIAGILLDISMFVTRVLSVLAPLITVLSWVSDIIFNRFTAGLTAAILAIVAMNAVLATMTTMSAAMGAGILGTIAGAIMPYISAVYSAITATWTWIKSLGALRGALALTGIGLVALGAGALAAGAMDDMGGGAPRSGPRGEGAQYGGTNIYIQGNVEKKQMDRLMDEMPEATRKEINMAEEMNR